MARTRPMGKRRAMREAHGVVAKLIDSYFDVGQPDENCMDSVAGWIPADQHVLRDAFELIADQHARKARG